MKKILLILPVIGLLAACERRVDEPVGAPDAYDIRTNDLQMMPPPPTKAPVPPPVDPLPTDDPPPQPPELLQPPPDDN